ncbi:MAG TPA: nitroreductase family deazaflavin-dependent oxidoreductase [Candidatus Limnocylindrales bacterium]
MTEQTMEKQPLVLPRWLVRTIWKLHRVAYAVTGGRFGLRTVAPGRWGMLRLTTTGRRSGKRRVAIVGYLEDGPSIVVPAMNGWADPEPAWLLNLQADADATVELPGGETREVTARVPDDAERRRLWQRFLDLGTSAYTEANEALRSRETAIVVLEPRSR